MEEIQVLLKTETVDKIVLMIKNSPLFPEDVKEEVLNDIRKEMSEDWKEPGLTDSNYLRSYYNNMFK